MSGTDPIAELLYHLEFAALMAFAALWQTRTWLVLLACIPLGALLRSFWERRSAGLLGSMLMMVVLALNTALVGLNLADDPDVFRGLWPDYFFPLVVMLCWLLHLPLGLLALGLGIGAVEFAAGLSAGRRRFGAGRPRHGPGGGEP